MTATDGNKPWKARLLGVETANPYFSVLRQDVTVTDGTHRVYHTIHFPRAAVGVVARRGSEFLLLRQYRFIIDEFVWAIPSGGVDPSESLEGAARRELLEESGYHAAVLRPLMFCFASYGCSNQRFEIFLANDLTPVRDGFPDGNEVIEARWFAREEILAMIARNEIVDSLSLSPILHLLLADERAANAGGCDAHKQ